MLLAVSLHSQHTSCFIPYHYLVLSVLTKLKTAYLLIYNGIQWSGFILVVVTLLKALRGGESKREGLHRNQWDFMEP